LNKCTPPLANSSDKADDFWAAVDAYRNQFKDLPTIAGASSLQEKMTKVLRDAVRNGKPLNDSQWYEALGLEPPPPGSVV